MAQDHNMTVGRDITLSTPSLTRREDLAAMMRHRSRSLLSLTVVSGSISLVINYIIIELVLLLLIVNYIVDLMMCVIFVLYSLPVLKAPHPGRQSKRAVVK
jgi:hypothetical protein